MACPWIATVPGAGNEIVVLEPMGGFDALVFEAGWGIINSPDRITIF
ncbi:hypothetical protein [Methylococcus geothermalis]|uniref:Uncharacterized protein n=1 Tax=Methylococcus geothermalis TaxID=2681310 RepID=A0A858QAE8_9GAMM|nr:hypothetical protein [Methylococcus geothermalis]QJD30858.1 hypothetical protein GNH96_13370 [Methylococcus geothermalis]